MKPNAKAYLYKIPVPGAGIFMIPCEPADATVGWLGAQLQFAIHTDAVCKQTERMTHVGFHIETTEGIALIILVETTAPCLVTKGDKIGLEPITMRVRPRIVH